MGDARLLKVLVEDGDQLLGNGEGEDELGSNNQDLGQETLEEGAESLVADHLLDDAHTTLRVIKVAVLDTGLDDIQGSSNGDRGNGSSDGGTEVLEEGGLVVVLKSENPLLDKGASSEQSKGSRGVTTSGPESTSIQRNRKGRVDRVSSIERGKMRRHFAARDKRKKEKRKWLKSYQLQRARR